LKVEKEIKTHGTVFIPMKNIPPAKVDLNDYIQYELHKYKWSHSNGYICRSVRILGGKYKRIYLHREITENKWKLVDHINRDRSDNRKCNLRESDHAKNKMNSKPHGNRRYKGVQKSWSRFKAAIIVDGKYYHIGTYQTEIEAAKGYNAVAEEFFGNYARLNEI